MNELNSAHLSSITFINSNGVIITTEIKEANRRTQGNLINDNEGNYTFCEKDLEHIKNLVLTLKPFHKEYEDNILFRIKKRKDKYRCEWVLLLKTVREDLIKKKNGTFIDINVKSDLGQVCEQPGHVHEPKWVHAKEDEVEEKTFACTDIKDIMLKYVYCVTYFDNYIIKLRNEIGILYNSDNDNFLSQLIKINNHFTKKTRKEYDEFVLTNRHTEGDGKLIHHGDAKVGLLNSDFSGIGSGICGGNILSNEKLNNIRSCGDNLRSCDHCDGASNADVTRTSCDNTGLELRQKICAKKSASKYNLHKVLSTCSNVNSNVSTCISARPNVLPSVNSSLNSSVTGSLNDDRNADSMANSGDDSSAHSNTYASAHASVEANVDVTPNYNYNYNNEYALCSSPRMENTPRARNDEIAIKNCDGEEERNLSFFKKLLYNKFGFEKSSKSKEKNKNANSHNLSVEKENDNYSLERVRDEIRELAEPSLAVHGEGSRSADISGHDRGYRLEEEDYHKRDDNPEKEQIDNSKSRSNNSNDWHGGKDESSAPVMKQKGNGDCGATNVQSSVERSTKILKKNNKGNNIPVNVDNLRRVLANFLKENGMNRKMNGEKAGKNRNSTERHHDVQHSNNRSSVFHENVHMLNEISTDALLNIFNRLNCSAVKDDFLPQENEHPGIPSSSSFQRFVEDSAEMHKKSAHRSGSRNDITINENSIGSGSAAHQENNRTPEGGEPSADLEEEANIELIKLILKEHKKNICSRGGGGSSTERNKNMLRKHLPLNVHRKDCIDERFKEGHSKENLYMGDNLRNDRTRNDKRFHFHHHCHHRDESFEEGNGRLPNVEVSEEDEMKENCMNVSDHVSNKTSRRITSNVTNDKASTSCSSSATVSPNRDKVINKSKYDSPSRKRTDYNNDQADYVHYNLMNEKREPSQSTDKNRLADNSTYDRIATDVIKYMLQCNDNRRILKTCMNDNTDNTTTSNDSHEGNYGSDACPSNEYNDILRNAIADFLKNLPRSEISHLVANKGDISPKTDNAPKSGKDSWAQVRSGNEPTCSNMAHMSLNQLCELAHDQHFQSCSARNDTELRNPHCNNMENILNMIKEAMKSNRDDLGNVHSGLPHGGSSSSNKKKVEQDITRRDISPPSEGTNLAGNIDYHKKSETLPKDESKSSSMEGGERKTDHPSGIEVTKNNSSDVSNSIINSGSGIQKSCRVSSNNSALKGVHSEACEETSTKNCSNAYYSNNDTNGSSNNSQTDNFNHGNDTRNDIRQTLSLLDENMDLLYDYCLQACKNSMAHTKKGLHNETNDATVGSLEPEGNVNCANCSHHAGHAKSSNEGPGQSQINNLLSTKGSTKCDSSSHNVEEPKSEKDDPKENANYSNSCSNNSPLNNVNLNFSDNYNNAKSIVDQVNSFFHNCLCNLKRMNDMVLQNNLSSAENKNDGGRDNSDSCNNRSSDCANSSGHVNNNSDRSNNSQYDQILCHIKNNLKNRRNAKSVDELLNESLNPNEEQHQRYHEGNVEGNDRINPSALKNVQSGNLLNTIRGIDVCDRKVVEETCGSGGGKDLNSVNSLNCTKDTDSVEAFQNLDSDFSAQMNKYENNEIPSNYQQSIMKIVEDFCNRKKSNFHSFQEGGNGEKSTGEYTDEHILRAVLINMIKELCTAKGDSSLARELSTLKNTSRRSGSRGNGYSGHPRYNRGYVRHGNHGNREDHSRHSSHASCEEYNRHSDHKRHNRHNKYIRRNSHSSQASNDSNGSNNECCSVFSSSCDERKKHSSSPPKKRNTNQNNTSANATYSNCPNSMNSNINFQTSADTFNNIYNNLVIKNNINNSNNYYGNYCQNNIININNCGGNNYFYNNGKVSRSESNVLQDGHVMTDAINIQGNVKCMPKNNIDFNAPSNIIRRLQRKNISAYHMSEFKHPHSDKHSMYENNSCDDSMPGGGCTIGRSAVDVSANDASVNDGSANDDSANDDGANNHSANNNSANDDSTNDASVNDDSSSHVSANDVNADRRISDSCSGDMPHDDELNMDERNIDKPNLFDGNLHGENIFDENIGSTNIGDVNLDVDNMYSDNMYSENVCGGDLYTEELYGDNLCNADIHSGNSYSGNIYRDNMCSGNMCSDNMNHSDNSDDTDNDDTSYDDNNNNTTSDVQEEEETMLVQGENILMQKEREEEEEAQKNEVLSNLNAEHANFNQLRIVEMDNWGSNMNGGNIYDDDDFSQVEEMDVSENESVNDEQYNAVADMIHPTFDYNIGNFDYSDSNGNWGNNELDECGTKFEYQLDDNFQGPRFGEDETCPSNGLPKMSKKMECFDEFQIMNRDKYAFIFNSNVEDYYETVSNAPSYAHSRGVLNDGTGGIYNVPDELDAEMKEENYISLRDTLWEKKGSHIFDDPIGRNLHQMDETNSSLSMDIKNLRQGDLKKLLFHKMLYRSCLNGEEEENSDDDDDENDDDEEEESEDEEENPPQHQRMQHEEGKSESSNTHETEEKDKDPVGQDLYYNDMNTSTSGNESANPEVSGGSNVDNSSSSYISLNINFFCLFDDMYDNFFKEDFQDREKMLKILNLNKNLCYNQLLMFYKKKIFFECKNENNSNLSLDCLPMYDGSSRSLEQAKGSISSSSSNSECNILYGINSPVIICSNDQKNNTIIVDDRSSFDASHSEDSLVPTVPYNGIAHKGDADTHIQINTENKEVIQNFADPYDLSKEEYVDSPALRIKEEMFCFKKVIKQLRELQNIINNKLHEKSKSYMGEVKVEDDNLGLGATSPFRKKEELDNDEKKRTRGSIPFDAATINESNYSGVVKNEMKFADGIVQKNERGEEYYITAGFPSEKNLVPKKINGPREEQNIKNDVNFKDDRECKTTLKNKIIKPKQEKVKCDTKEELHESKRNVDMYDGYVSENSVDSDNAYELVKCVLEYDVENSKSADISSDQQRSGDYAGGSFQMNTHAPGGNAPIEFEISVDSSMEENDVMFKFIYHKINCIRNNMWSQSIDELQNKEIQETLRKCRKKGGTTCSSDGTYSDYKMMKKEKEHCGGEMIQTIPAQAQTQKTEMNSINANDIYYFNIYTNLWENIDLNVSNKLLELRQMKKRRINKYYKNNAYENTKFITFTEWSLYNLIISKIYRSFDAKKFEQYQLKFYNMGKFQYELKKRGTYNFGIKIIGDSNGKCGGVGGPPTSAKGKGHRIDEKRNNRKRRTSKFSDDDSDLNYDDDDYEEEDDDESDDSDEDYEEGSDDEEEEELMNDEEGQKKQDYKELETEEHDSNDFVFINRGTVRSRNAKDAKTGGNSTKKDGEKNFPMGAKNSRSSNGNSHNSGSRTFCKNKSKNGNRLCVSNKDYRMYNNSADRKSAKELREDKITIDTKDEMVWNKKMKNSFSRSKAKQPLEEEEENSNRRSTGMSLRRKKRNSVLSGNSTENSLIKANKRKNKKLKVSAKVDKYGEKVIDPGATRLRSGRISKGVARRGSNNGHTRNRKVQVFKKRVSRRRNFNPLVDRKPNVYYQIQLPDYASHKELIKSRNDCLPTYILQYEQLKKNECIFFNIQNHYNSFINNVYHFAISYEQSLKHNEYLNNTLNNVKARLHIKRLCLKKKVTLKDNPFEVCNTYFNDMYTYDSVNNTYVLSKTKNMRMKKLEKTINNQDYYSMYVNDYIENELLNKRKRNKKKCSENVLCDGDTTAVKKLALLRHQTEGYAGGNGSQQAGAYEEVIAYDVANQYELVNPYGSSFQNGNEIDNQREIARNDHMEGGRTSHEDSVYVARNTYHMQNVRSNENNNGDGRNDNKDNVDCMGKDHINRKKFINCINRVPQIDGGSTGHIHGEAELARGDLELCSQLKYLNYFVDNVEDDHACNNGTCKNVMSFSKRTIEEELADVDHEPEQENQHEQDVHLGETSTFKPKQNRAFPPEELSTYTNDFDDENDKTHFNKTNGHFFNYYEEKDHSNNNNKNNNDNNNDNHSDSDDRGSFFQEQENGKNKNHSENNKEFYFNSSVNHDDIIQYIDIQ
ncbi:Uncharacterized protein PCOAH_00044870 [Plasmodium coatneyi]|uniref:Uncharacterized protein n=1 Tax=Plasmodium coatneyi TaxID=208452 RepID=A0A1B1E5F3_9APIC|nr:Uncharacterized protein PCOAH_00044870 [Plasmodium coatneyi]ANQ10225.1 Uncharacterized protein PCOAH_00044870 [Plasmodium coatneyi]